MAGNNVDWKDPQAVLAWLETQPTLASLRHAAEQLGVHLEGKPRKAAIIETLRRHVEKQAKSVTEPEPAAPVPTAAPAPAAEAVIPAIPSPPPQPLNLEGRVRALTELERKHGEAIRRLEQRLAPGQDMFSQLTKLIQDSRRTLDDFGALAERLELAATAAHAEAERLEKLKAEVEKATASLLEALAQLQQAAAYTPAVAEEVIVIPPTKAAPALEAEAAVQAPTQAQEEMGGRVPTRVPAVQTFVGSLLRRFYKELRREFYGREVD